MEKIIKTRKNLLKIFFFIFLPSLFIFLVLEKKYLQTNFLEKISVFSYAQKNYFIDFKLNKINLNNLKYIKKSEIYEKLNSYYNTKIFSIELDSIREKIKSNQLVSEVSIDRILPSTLNINIIEKKPIGIIQNKNLYKLITSDGSIVFNKQIHEFYYLPIFSGKNVEKNAQSIIDLLNLANFKEEIWSMSLINERRWNLNLKKGIKILLPEHNLIKALNLINNIEEKHKILDGNFIEIDLRNDNQVIFKPLLKSLNKQRVKK